MDNLFEDNQAGKRLLVGELEVIGEISGKGFKEIKTSINAIQTQNKSFQAQQQNYWKDLASDSVITPSEKKTLYKEFLSIQQSYAAIDRQATEQGLQNESYVLYYKGAYDGLYEYLYETLRVFDDMQINTSVNSSELNTFYSNYYFWQNYATIGLTTGIIGNFDLKALHSLNDPGEEGQIGVYKGQIYQYTSGIWKPVGLEGYIGARDSVPAASLNQYFIASDDFIGYDNLFINDEQLLINDEELIIGLMYEKGFIYAYEQSGWIKVADKTDYRYVVAMTDLVQITGELPGVYQQAIDTAVDAVKKEYKGPLLNPPSNPHNGDYFVYTGIEHDDWHNSCIYKYDSVNRRWDFMDPTESLNGPLYQSCLDDILKQKNLENGYFAAIFASSFFAHAATMDQLSVQEIRIKNDGCIVSEGDAQGHGGYVYHRQGLKIDSSGDIDANGNTHIGGTLKVDGETTISGNAILEGKIVNDVISTEDLYEDLTIKEWKAGCTDIAGIMYYLANLSNVNIPAGNAFDITFRVPNFRVWVQGLGMVTHVNCVLRQVGMGESFTMTFMDQTTAPIKKLDECGWFASADYDYYPLNHTLTVSKTVEGQGLVIKQDIQETVSLPGYIYNKNGLLQMTTQSPVIKLNYPAGTSVKKIFIDLIENIKSDAELEVSVSCIGNYGFRSINSIKQTTGGVRVNFALRDGSTNVINISYSSTGTITNSLNLLFIYTSL